MANDRRIAFVHNRHPGEVLSKQQLETVNNLLLKAVDEAPVGDCYSFVTSIHAPGGYLALVAQNDTTLEWVKSITGAIQFTVQCPVRIVSKDEIPKANIVFVKVNKKGLKANQFLFSRSGIRNTV